MNILVIRAYPNQTGLNYAIKEKVMNNLNSKHNVTEIDLYKVNSIIVSNGK